MRARGEILSRVEHVERGEGVGVGVGELESELDSWSRSRRVGILAV